VLTRYDVVSRGRLGFGGRRVEALYPFLLLRSLLNVGWFPLANYGGDRFRGGFN